MDMNYLCHMNYLAILGASVVYFFIGSFWFSTLFGSAWTRELARHNVVIKAPTTIKLLFKMVVTFLSNLLTAIGFSCLVHAIDSTTALSGLYLGLTVSICFVIPTVATIFSWESRSIKLFLIDVGYPVLGIIATSVILSVWR